MRVVIPAEGQSAFVQLCGISLLERLLRLLDRAGVSEATILSPSPDQVAERLGPPAWARKRLTIRVAGRAAGPLCVSHVFHACPDDELIWVLPAGGVYDGRLIEWMSEQRSPIALVDSAAPPSIRSLLSGALPTQKGLLVGPAMLARSWAEARTGPLLDEIQRGLEDDSLPSKDVAMLPTYSLAMRRELRPYWFPVTNRTSLREAERVILGAAQKGALDFPAWVHGPIETFLVSFLCKTRITPNQLTFLCNLVAWTATVLFATGQIGWGTGLALAVGILDGIDGKQARVKVETTKAGKLEHWFDTFFEVSWAVALAYWFARSGQLPGAFAYLLLLMVSEAIDGIAKAGIILTYGRLIDELSPLDRAIRFIGGRRNVYVWILAAGVLLGSASTAFVVIAWWEAATAAIHVPRAAWAIWARPYDFTRNVNA